MTSSYPLVQLGEVLTLALDETPVESASEYPIAGVYSFGRGVLRRAPISGDQTKYKRLNRLHADRVVLSRLKAFEGAIAVVPKHAEGFYVSQEFPTFDIDTTRVLPEYMAYLC